MKTTFELIYLWYLTVFVLFWALIIIIVGKLSGWSTLAKRFSLLNSDNFQFQNYQTIRLGFSNYSGCVGLAVSSQGLAMRTMAFFRFGHPDLLIPWSQLEFKGEKSFLFYKFCSYRIHFEGKEMGLILPHAISKKIIESGYLEAKD